MIPNLQPLPEVFDLMTLTGQLRRVHADRLVPRLLEEAERRKHKPIQWHPAPTAHNRALQTQSLQGVIAVGAGASFGRASRDEILSCAQITTGLSRASCEAAADVLEDAAHGLFARDYAHSVGFLGLVPAMEVNRPQPDLGLLVKHSAPKPRVFVTARKGAPLAPLHWPLRGGGKVKLNLPTSLLALPEGGDSSVPLAYREIEYVVHGPLLSEGPQTATQTGFGASPPGEIENGRWFPSGKQGVRRDKLGESDLSFHPLIYIGRLTVPSGVGADPCVDMLLLSVNPEQEGAIDFIGTQSTSAALSSVLRWDLWSVFLAWARIDDFQFLDRDTTVVVSNEPVAKKGATSATGARKPKNLKTAWLDGEPVSSPLLTKLAALREDLDADTRPHRRRLLEMVASLDEARGAPIDQQQQHVDQVNGLLIRLGVHIPCPTCGKASVLLLRKSLSYSGERAAIAAQHTAVDDRSKHVPSSWARVTTLIDREYLRESSQSTNTRAVPRK